MKKFSKKVTITQLATMIEALITTKSPAQPITEKPLPLDLLKTKIPSQLER